MPVFRIAAAAIVVALPATAQAIAASGFTGNVCTLITAKQVTPINGSRSRCTKAPTTQGPGSTINVGNWAGPAGTTPLQVTVALYTDQGALQVATRNLKQGLPGGKPRKVTGIGSAANEASGATSTGLHFSVGKYIVYLTLNKPRATAPVETIAKTIAARL